MDATLRSLEKFDDPTQWDLVDTNVPIFMEHEARDEDGKLIYKVDRAKLYQVAEEINRLWEQNDCAVKLFEGHTKNAGQVGQKDQPKLLGYGVRAHVGEVGRSGRLAVLLDKTFIRKGCGRIVEELPERSPEFYPKTGRIKAVAYLKTDPRLDMGMTIYQRLDGAVLYARGFDMAFDPTKMPRGQNDMDDTDTATLPDDGDMDELDEAEKAKFMKYMKACYPEAHKNYAVGAMPSATNTGMPSDDKDMPQVMLPSSGKDKPAREPNPYGFQAEVDAIRYGKVEKRLKELEDKNKRIACEDAVRKLAYEGYFIRDSEKEVQRLMRMDQPERDERIAEIRANYQRDPAAGDMIGVERGDSAASYGVMTGAQVNAMVIYCEENNLDFSNQEHYARAMGAVLGKGGAKVRR